MVGVGGSSPLAPTNFGRPIKHLAEMLGAFFLPVGQEWGKWGHLSGRIANMLMCRRDPARKKYAVLKEQSRLAVMLQSRSITSARGAAARRIAVHVSM